MAAKKYFYNPETCTYEPVRKRKTNVFIGLMGFVLVSFALASLITIVFNTYYDTPSEARLKKENRNLEIHYANLAKSIEETDQMITVLEQRNNNLYNKIHETRSGQKELLGDGLISPSFDALYTKGGKDKSILETFGKQIDQLSGQTKSSNSSLSLVSKKALDKNELLKFIPTIQPINNNELTALASGFGKRMNPYHHGIMDHEGIDFTAPIGTQVMSTAGGKVIFSKISTADTGYGTRVDIDHGNGYITRYTHLNEIFVKPGDVVEKHFVIGTVGTSGGTIAPSIHYEIIRNGKKVNPVNYFIQGLSESDFVIILELALRENQSLD